MSSIILVTGNPKSKTHYTANMITNHPNIKGLPRREPLGVDTTITEYSMKEYLSINAQSSGVVVINNHSWIFYLDLVRNYSDLYVVSCIRRDIEKYFCYFYPSLLENVDRLFWDAHREARMKLGLVPVSYPNEVWERFMSYVYDTRKIVFEKSDVIIDDANFETSMKKIFKDNGLKDVSIEELSKGIIFQPDFYRCYDLIYDENKTRYGKFSVEKDAAEDAKKIIKTKEFKSWIKDIEDLG